MSRTGWEHALSSFEAALDSLEQAGPDELEEAALRLERARPPTGGGPIPGLLVRRAQGLERRMAALVADLEGRRAAVGSELAALGAMAGSSGDRAVPKFLDTRA